VAVEIGEPGCETGCVAGCALVEPGEPVWEVGADVFGALVPCTAFAGCSRYHPPPAASKTAAAIAAYKTPRWEPSGERSCVITGSSSGNAFDSRNGQGFRGMFFSRCDLGGVLRFFAFDEVLRRRRSGGVASQRLEPRRNFHFFRVQR